MIALARIWYQILDNFPMRHR